MGRKTGLPLLDEDPPADIDIRQRHTMKKACQSNRMRTRSALQPRRTLSRQGRANRRNRNAAVRSLEVQQRLYLQIGGLPALAGAGDFQYVGIAVARDDADILVALAEQGRELTVDAVRVPQDIAYFGLAEARRRRADYAEQAVFDRRLVAA